MGNIKVHILMGLPGSGKTTWAKEYYEKNHNKKGDKRLIIDICDLDKILEDYRMTYENMTMRDVIQHVISRNMGSAFRSRPYETIEFEYIFDGLYTRMEEIDYTIDELRKAREESGSYATIDVIIHRWTPNIEFCLSNDSGRREESSEITIKNATVEYVDVNPLIEKYGGNFSFCVEVHEVIKATERQKFIGKYGKEIQSKSWTTGGMWGDCWGNEGSVSPEPVALFTELDEILLKVCPNLSYLEYKVMADKLIHQVEKTSYGYYGSYEEYSYWTINTGELYDYLHEKNII